MRKTSEQTYDELKNMYDIYINKIANFIKEMPMSLDKDPLKAYEFLCLLYKTGIVSNNCNYQYDKTKKYKDITQRGILGAELVTGFAVCRHITYFIHDVLRELGYESNVIIINVPNIKKINNIKVKNNLLLFERDLIVEKLSFKRQKRINRLYGNHLILGMKIKNEYVLLDPTNACYYLNNDEFQINNKILEEYIKYDISSKETYSAKKENIVISNFYQIGIIKQAFKDKKEGNTLCEIGINENEIKEKLSSLIDIEKLLKKNVDREYLSNYKRILDFYRSNSKFFNEFSNKILSLTK